MPRAPSPERFGAGALIVHGFTIALVPHRFLVSMAVLVCATLAQAQIDSAYILTVDRRVQAINAEKDHEVRTLENDEFLEYTTDGGGAALPWPVRQGRAPIDALLP